MPTAKNERILQSVIAKNYAETQADKQKIEVYERAMSYSITSTNEVKRESKTSWENNLNQARQY